MVSSTAYSTAGPVRKMAFDRNAIVSQTNWLKPEYYNADKKYTAPAGYMITQTIKADGNGVFTYAAPVSGWWGFAALNGAGYKLPYHGDEKDVELGAVIWVYFHEMK